MQLLIFCSVGLACFLGCTVWRSGQTITALTYLRALFVLVVLFWVRCECFVWMRVDVDETITALAYLRALFVLVVLFWVRCECFMSMRADDMCHVVEAMSIATEAYRTAKRGDVSVSDYHTLLCEINSLSQTILRLSDQKALLQDIRGGVLKSARYSKHAFGLLNGGGASPKRTGSSSDMAWRKLHRCGFSDSCLSLPDVGL
jgi:hypothetical protein